MSPTAAPPLRPRSRRAPLARALAAAALAAAAYFLLPWALPWPDALSQPVPSGLRLTDRSGQPLRRLLADGHRSHPPGPLAEFPEFLIAATLAAEDQRFFHHGGIDAPAILRALRDSLRARRAVSGASTITQQLVKLASPQPRTLLTKLREMLTARRVEMTWSKPRILQNYFARLDYGNLHRGPQAAALGYFGKPLPDCSLAECALLAALPQAPSRLNPWRNPAPALKRQQWILHRLRLLGHIDPATLDRALAEPLRWRRHFDAFAAPHFTDLLLQPNPSSLPPPPQEGDWITSLDLPLQQVCERSLADRLQRLRSHNATQAAAVVIHNPTGEVRALVGSLDYQNPDSGQVNGATAPRSPGSALKPFTYLLALSENLSPASILPDLPIEYLTETGLYRPQNYSRRAAGPVSLRAALANSLNLSAVRLLQSHGGPTALVACLQAAGITTLTKPPSSYGLGLTIGGGEVTLLELAGAYSTLARLGRSLPLRFTPAPNQPTGTPIFDPDACWLLADILSDNQARARSFGTASPLRFPFPCAIKTGTSTDYRDNWALAYNPTFTVGVWVGNFDNSPMRGVSGVTGAAPLLRDIFSWLHAHHPSPWFPQPPSIVQVDIDPLTGLPRPQALAARRPLATELFRRDLAPSAPDPLRYDELGRVRLDPSYAPWLASPDNWLGNDAVASALPAPRQAWQISSPLAGTTLLLDPDLPQGGTALTLRTDPPQPGIQWSSPSLHIQDHTASLTPGRHEITARDPATGLSRSTWIQVQRF